MIAMSKGIIDKIDTLWSSVGKGRNAERDGLRSKQCLKKNDSGK